jgi:hypothetical protein
MLGYRPEFWPRKESYIRQLFLKAGLADINTRNIVWQESTVSGKQVYEFFANTSGAWWYAKFPLHARKKDSNRMRAYFKLKDVNKITSDVMLVHGSKA